MDVKLQAQKVRITLKALEGLTYVCTDALLLQDVNKKLECVMSDMRSALPASDGLVVRPAIRERIKQSDMKSARRYSSLPLYQKRGKKRRDYKYRNRCFNHVNANSNNNLLITGS